MRFVRGFSLVDVLVVLAVIVVAVALILPTLGGSHHDRPLKDSTQIRGIHQAMVTWAQSNRDEYPIPSHIDTNDWTVPERGAAKDTTANMLSMMIFNGSLPAEIMVSPMERNRNIRVCEDYEFEKPAGAVDPEKAMWDPKFSAVLDGTRPGNNSYAHLQLSGTRLERMTNSFADTRMIVGTRGPEIASVKKNADGSVMPTLANPRSNTLLFFGKSKTWSGNMAFNDNHVEFLKDWLVPGKPFPASRGRMYDAADGKKWPDIWCFDEPDDPKGANDFLGIFLKAGETPRDFKAAWD